MALPTDADNMPLVDGAADVLSGNDMISPVVAWFRGLGKGPYVMFMVSVDCGSSANGVRGMLRDAGITVWKVQVKGDYITFRVRDGDIGKTKAQLLRHKMPFEIEGQGGGNGPGTMSRRGR